MSMRTWVADVQCLTGVVAEHPGEHRVLSKVIITPACNYMYRRGGGGAKEDELT